MSVNKVRLFLLGRGVVDRSVEEFAFSSRGEDRVMSSLGGTRIGAGQKGDSNRELWHHISRGLSIRAQMTEAAVTGWFGREEG